MTDQEKAALKAAGRLADIAGRICGVDLNGFRKRPCKAATVDDLWFELPNLQSAVFAYNEAIMQLPIVSGDSSDE
jgi:hypothetical protein